MFLKAMLDYVKVRYLNHVLGEKGQGIVEYALILAFVVVLAAFLTNAGGLGEAVQGVFDRITGQLNDAAPAPAGG